MKGAAVFSAVGRVGDYGFAVLEAVDIVGAEFDASRFSGFGAAVAFVGVDYREPRVVCACQLFTGLLSD